MSNKDKALKEYFGKNKHFAELINSFVFKGNERIKETDLESVDTELIFKGNERIRDLAKAVKKDKKNYYCILGVENQSYIDKNMPIRCMLYDAMSLINQVETKGRKSIIPVITLVLFWSDTKWNGPITLSEMYSSYDDTLKQFLPDYKMNLIEPNSLSDEELGKVVGDVGRIFSIIKYQHDKIKLDKELCKKEFADIGIDSVKLIETLTDTKIDNYKEDKKEFDMFTAWIEQKEDGIKIGLEKGIEQGIEQGIAVTVKILKDLGLDEETIAMKIAKEYNLTIESSKEKVNALLNK